MIDFSQAFNDIRKSDLAPWMERLPNDIAATFDKYSHGELIAWHQMIDQLENSSISDINLTDQVNVIGERQLSADQKEKLTEQLMLLHPWRKGPFHIHGLHIDTEWRSDWKWQRIQPHIADLSGRTILDVGCGNGYHLFRMQGAGAKLSIGIDPSQKFLSQFRAIKHFFGQLPVHLFPLGIEDIPDMPLFDTVFSMGVLYHRRSPIEHIQKLKGMLRKGGEMVLETLVYEDDHDNNNSDKNTVFLPDGRYAQMRNVWFLPSVEALIHWMKRCDLKNVRLIDKSRTTTEEQRSTKWMHFHSLKDYLDPNDHTKTIEGYPGPVRATIVAEC